MSKTRNPAEGIGKISFNKTLKSHLERLTSLRGRRDAGTLSQREMVEGERLYHELLPGLNALLAVFKSAGLMKMDLEESKDYAQQHPTETFAKIIISFTMRAKLERLTALEERRDAGTLRVREINEFNRLYDEVRPTFIEVSDIFSLAGMLTIEPGQVSGMVEREIAAATNKPERVIRTLHIRFVS